MICDIHRLHVLFVKAILALFFRFFVALYRDSVLVLKLGLYVKEILKTVF